VGNARRASRCTQFCVLLAFATSLSGCIHDEFAIYNLAVVNSGASDRLIVLGTSLDGSSSQPAVSVPADGTLRVTRASTVIAAMPGPDAAAVLLIYDLDCVLVDRVVIHTGNYVLTLHGDDPPALTRVTSPPSDAPLLAESLASCPGAMPQSRLEGEEHRGAFM